MKFPALRITQSGRRLYLAKMTAEQILACCQTAEWDPDRGWDINVQGYQRAPVENHLQGIGQFLATTPDVFMPTSALLSARERENGNLNFSVLHTALGAEFGELEVEEWRQFVIVDYQHRWRGLRHSIETLGASAIKGFAVPVTIIADLDKAEEIEQFFLINSKQRRIDTDLALALLQTLASDASLKQLYNLAGPGKRFRVPATRLAFKFAAQSDGVWVVKINQPHDLPQPNAVIRLKSFVDSLAPIVSARSDFSKLNLTDDEILRVMTDYWTAVSQLLEPCFQNPAHYQLQRTVGTFAHHLLLARKVFPAALAQGSTRTETFRLLLSGTAKEFLEPGFWETRGPATLYVGSAGYRELARLMGAHL